MLNPRSRSSYRPHGNELPKNSGLTIREEFARSFLAAHFSVNGMSESGIFTFEDLAAKAVKAADALIKQLGREDSD